jgi:hypothetical protein
MATMRHTPHGRGYDDSLHYFHHEEDYWQSWFQVSKLQVLEFANRV